VSRIAARLKGSAAGSTARQLLCWGRSKELFVAVTMACNSLCPQRDGARAMPGDRRHQSLPSFAGKVIEVLVRGEDDRLLRRKRAYLS
jgi:hypothetical protein